MSLETRLDSLIAAIGADVKELQQGGSSSDSGLLGLTIYNPASKVTWSKNGTFSNIITDLDVSNLSVSFLAPVSGRVLINLSATIVNGSSGEAPQVNWLLRDSSNTIFMSEPLVVPNEVNTDSRGKGFARAMVSGLTANQTYTLKWSWEVVTNGFSARMYAGGPISDSSYPGKAMMEVWKT